MFRMIVLFVGCALLFGCSEKPKGPAIVIRLKQEDVDKLRGVVHAAAPDVGNKTRLFVWAGDDAKKAEDFLAVIDADPVSPRYGQVISSVAVPGPSGTPHHTELFMPAGGHLLANQHESGGSVLFDVSDPERPRVMKTFGDLGRYVHPHTYVRTANERVLATFQYGAFRRQPSAVSTTKHAGDGGEYHDHKALGKETPAGGIVELTEEGRVIRAGSAVDSHAKGELIRPYSLVEVPRLERVVSTNTSMHFRDEGTTRTVQVWRRRDLKRLKTIALEDPTGGKHNELPGEPVLAEDGETVLVHTFTCGLYELRNIETPTPAVRLRRTFDSELCGVPLRVRHWWIATLFDKHAVAVYDLNAPEMPEVSRITLDGQQKPHWLSDDLGGKRIVLNSGEYGEHRIYMLEFDPASGKLTIDEKFRDPGSDKTGVSMDGKQWPHGFNGDAYPHGAVISR